MIHLDTSLLVDLDREVRRSRPGPALDFLESLDDREVLAVSVHAVCELRVGSELAPKALKAHDALDHLLSNLLICYPDDRFPSEFARLSAATTRSGRIVVPAMDLLIATAAVLDNAPLVTRNVKGFSRVPGLRVLKY